MFPPRRHSRESGNPVRHTIPVKAGIQNDKHNVPTPPSFPRKRESSQIMPFPRRREYKMINTMFPPRRHSRESGNPVRHIIPVKAGIQNDKHNVPAPPSFPRKRESSQIMPFPRKREYKMINTILNGSICMMNSCCRRNRSINWIPAFAGMTARGRNDERRREWVY